MTTQFSTNSLDQNSPNAQFRNTPTIDVVRNTPSLSLANIAWVNFISSLSVTINTSSLVTGQRISFTNTGLHGPASISLSNGGNVGGSKVYQLATSSATTPVQMEFDGTNLNVLD